MKKTYKSVSPYLKYIALFVSAVIVGLDQYFKYLAITFLSNDIITLPIIKDFFHLTYIENRGAAFSILEGKKFFLVGLTAIVIIAGIVFLLVGKVKSRLLIWAGALVIGGGIGNLVDRIFRGFVVDYLDFRVINFAVFNFADTCVVVGTGLIMVYILFIEAKKSQKQDLPKAEEALGESPTVEIIEESSVKDGE